MPLLLIWTVAAAGIFLTLVFLGVVPHWAFTACFLGMGWTGLVGGVVLWRRHGFAFVRPLILGAAAYTLGAVLEYSSGPRFCRALSARTRFGTPMVAGRDLLPLEVHVSVWFLCLTIPATGRGSPGPRITPAWPPST